MLMGCQQAIDFAYSGLEADQKVIAAHGCYAMTATTALTAQNTQGVDDIQETPSPFVRKQIDACASDIGIDVVKTGTVRLFEAAWNSAKWMSVIANYYRDACICKYDHCRC